MSVGIKQKMKGQRRQLTTLEWTNLHCTNNTLTTV